MRRIAYQRATRTFGIITLSSAQDSSSFKVLAQGSWEAVAELKLEPGELGTAVCSCTHPSKPDVEVRPCLLKLLFSQVTCTSGMHDSVGGATLGNFQIYAYASVANAVRQSCSSTQNNSECSTARPVFVVAVGGVFVGYISRFYYNSSSATMMSGPTAVSYTHLTLPTKA